MLKLLFYAHNVQGLGHIVRVAQIASAASRLPDCDCMIVTGCRYLRHLRLPADLRIEELPAVVTRNGRFVAADRPEVGSADVIAARGERILAITRNLKPHAILVDHHPLGLMGEILPTLNAAVEERWPTRFVWGIPYIEGSIRSARPPANPRIARAMAHYDSAIAYLEPGEADVFSRLPSWVVPERREFVGTVVEAPLPSLPPLPGLVVLACGGGSHATKLCARIAAAFDLLCRDAHALLRVLLGPMAETTTARAALERIPLVEIWETGTLREVIRDASAVVSTCGYNSAALLMRTELPVVFVPVSQDQMSRAQLLHARPGVWVADNGEPRVLADAIARALSAGRAPRAAAQPADGGVAAATRLRSAAERAAALEPQRYGGGH